MDGAIWPASRHLAATSRPTDLVRTELPCALRAEQRILLIHWNEPTPTAQAFLRKCDRAAGAGAPRTEDARVHAQCRLPPPQQKWGDKDSGAGYSVLFLVYVIPGLP